MAAASTVSAPMVLAALPAFVLAIHPEADIEISFGMR
jgi:hypothetical protein